MEHWEDQSYRAFVPERTTWHWSPRLIEHSSLRKRSNTQSTKRIRVCVILFARSHKPIVFICSTTICALCSMCHVLVSMSFGMRRVHTILCTRLQTQTHNGGYCLKLHTDCVILEGVTICKHAKRIMSEKHPPPFPFAHSSKNILLILRTCELISDA